MNKKMSKEELEKFLKQEEAKIKRCDELAAYLFKPRKWYVWPFVFFTPKYRRASNEYHRIVMSFKSFM